MVGATVGEDMKEQFWSDCRGGIVGEIGRGEDTRDGGTDGVMEGSFSLEEDIEGLSKDNQDWRGREGRLVTLHVFQNMRWPCGYPSQKDNETWRRGHPGTWLRHYA